MEDHYTEENCSLKKIVGEETAPVETEEISWTKIDLIRVAVGQGVSSS